MSTQPTRLVIEHQAAQAYGEAAAAEVRVAELVAEESLQQGATLFWKSRDEHLTQQREMAANAEMALQDLKREAEEHVRERELQLQQWAQQLTAPRCRSSGGQEVRNRCCRS